MIECYAKRISWPFAVTELPDTGGKAPTVQPGTKIVALDETGDTLGSVALAKQFESWRDTGTREIRFLIGAADGLTPEELANADLKLSFGRLTWPHLLARAMLAEQLYRATAIIAGHPYHREG